MATVYGAYYNHVIIPAPVGSARDITPIFTETFTPGALNDTRRLNKVPINTCFGAGTFIQVSDMDTGGPTLTLTLRVTDGTTTKVLISASTAGQGGGLARPTLAPAVEDGIGFTTNNNDYWVELLYAAAATTPASGTFRWGLHLTGYASTGMKH